MAIRQTLLAFINIDALVRHHGTGPESRETRTEVATRGVDTLLVTLHTSHHTLILICKEPMGDKYKALRSQRHVVVALALARNLVAPTMFKKRLLEVKCHRLSKRSIVFSFKVSNFIMSIPSQIFSECVVLRPVLL